jgi:hypothetical protein
LYDLEQDPMEITNLAAKAEYAETTQQLRTELARKRDDIRP